MVLSVCKINACIHIICSSYKFCAPEQANHDNLLQKNKYHAWNPGITNQFLPVWRMSVLVAPCQSYPSNERVMHSQIAWGTILYHVYSQLIPEPICLHNFPKEMCVKCATRIFLLQQTWNHFINNYLTMAEYLSHIYKCSPNLTPASQHMKAFFRCIGAHRLSHCSSVA